MKTDIKLIATGLLAAVATFLCCGVPILALILGISGGFASSFGWIEPFRPYLIGFTVLVFSYLWYKKLKPSKQTACCETQEKQKFIQSKIFLSLITILVAIIMTLPYYSHLFYPKTEKQVQIIIVDKSNLKTVEYKVSGMTCDACQNYIKQEIDKAGGTITSEVSYEKGNALVTYDTTKTSVQDIEKVINFTGYMVTEIQNK